LKAELTGQFDQATELLGTLFQLRKARGMTQTQMADKIGIHVSQLS